MVAARAAAARIHSAIGDIAPVEHETSWYRQHNDMLLPEHQPTRAA